MSTPHLLSQLYVKLNGQDAPPDLIESIESIVVESSLHMADIAVLRIHDPRLRWLEDMSIDVGIALEVWSAVGGQEGCLFDGEIVEIEPEFTAHTQVLVVRAFDRLHRLTYGRQFRTFANITDKELIEKIADEVGLEATVGSTSEMHPYILQANISNLAFLQERAAALGYLLYADGKTLCCVPSSAEDAPLELQWGAGLIEFRPRLTTIGQVQQVTVRGWDPQNREEIVAEASESAGIPQVQETRSGGDLINEAFQIASHVVIADRPIRSRSAAEHLARATAEQFAARFIEAEGVCEGHPGLVAGYSVTIGSVGKRFGGTYFVTSAVHRASAGSYHTEFVVSGVNPVTLLSMLAPARPSTSIAGLCIGIVTDNRDPEDQGRVKVRFPWMSSDQTSDWARVVIPGGGAERGFAWLPEINDEVLIGFELGDMQYPYVLGGLWNGRDQPPESNTACIKDHKVQQRIIRSRSGHRIILNDDANEGGIIIEDRNGNRIRLDSQEDTATIQVHGDLTLKAEGTLTLDAMELKLNASGNVALQANGIVDIDGSGIELN